MILKFLPLIWSVNLDLFYEIKKSLFIIINKNKLKLVSIDYFFFLKLFAYMDNIVWVSIKVMCFVEILLPHHSANWYLFEWQFPQ
jgi:hypothetical protein